MAAIGTTASNYEILSKLAEGGMAELFLARVESQQGVRRHVVLKRIARERATDTQFVQMFLDEARLAAQLRHPNIAQVFDIGRLGVSYFFTMEYVHGVTVEDMIEKAAERGSVLPVDAILSILFGTAAGLQHAHERTGNDGKPLGIVHRDISPSNLMVTYDGHVKVVDFGVAKAQMSGRPETQAGEIKGKVGYLSPEQCRLLKLDRRSDLYSLGVVAWEMLTGKRLWKRETAFGTMAAIATEDVPLASEYREDLWPEVDALVGKLLATEVADRFQSAGAVIEAVELVSMTTKSNTSPSQLARLMRDLFGSPVEPWVTVREAVEVTASPIPAELDTQDDDPSMDTVEHKLTSVFSAVLPEHDDASSTNVLALPIDRLSTVSGDHDRAISSTGETREVPALARGPSLPTPRASQRAGTELLPPEPTEILPPEMPTQRTSNVDPAAQQTMIGGMLPPPLHLPRPSSAAISPSSPLVARGRMLPSGDPTVPLGTVLPGVRVLESAPRNAPSIPQFPPSGPQLPPSEPQQPSNAPQPRWPPPPHGNVGGMRWWIVGGGAVLGIGLVLLVLISRGDDRRVVAPPPQDAVTIVAMTPDAAADAEAVAIEVDGAPTVDAATVDAVEVSDAAPEVDDMKDLEATKPQPTSRRKLRTKSELNAAFRERRYKDIVTACREIGADGDRAVVCTLAACRARAKEAQDWYRNVPPKNRDGAINICKQSGFAIKDICATDLLACRK